MSIRIYSDNAWRNITGLSAFSLGAWKKIKIARVYSNAAWRVVYISSPTIFTYIDGSTMESADTIITSSSYIRYYSLKLKHVAFGADVVAIADGAFHTETGMTSVKFNYGLKYIGKDAFHLCASLTSINIPNTVTSIASAAFDSCYALSGLSISTSLTAIEDNTFRYTQGLSGIVIPDSVKYIGKEAFYTSGGNVKFTGGLTIGNSVTGIGNSAFFAVGWTTNPGFNSVIFPASLKALGRGTFSGCQKLANIKFKGNAPTLITNTFTQLPAAARVYYCSTRTGFTNPWGGITSVVDNTLC